MESTATAHTPHEKLFSIITNNDRTFFTLINNEDQYNLIQINLTLKTITIMTKMNPSRLLFLLSYIYDEWLPYEEIPMEVKKEADKIIDEYNMVLEIKTYSFLLGKDWKITNKHLINNPNQIRNLK